MACDAAGKAAFSFWSNIGVYISHVLLGKLGFFSTIFWAFLLLQKLYYVTLFSHVRTFKVIKSQKQLSKTPLSKKGPKVFLP